MGNKQTSTAGSEAEGSGTVLDQVAIDAAAAAAQAAAEKKAADKRTAEFAAAAAAAGDTTWLQRTSDNTPIPGGGSWHWNEAKRGWDDNLPQPDDATNPATSE